MMFIIIAVCVVVMCDRYVGHVLSNVHVPGSGPIWLDDVVCTNSCRTELYQCNHRDWGVHDCSHYEDVIIACYDRITTDELTTVPRT